MADATNRFSDRVENYRKYRPDYPKAVHKLFESNLGLTPASVIADIGSGTGISAKLFLDHGNVVYGVEPNDAMRAGAEDFLRAYPNFHSVKGTAEATNLPDASIDIVVAAQAFHWFDLEKTRQEFQRILKSDGYVALMWNQRDIDSTPFLRDYEALLRKYGTDYEQVAATYLLSAEKRQALFGPVSHEAAFPNVQTMDFEGLKGRVLSSSYMPTESDPAFEAMVEELRRIYDRHAQAGHVEHLYETKVYFGPLR